MLRSAASTMIPDWTWVMSSLLATTLIRSALVIALRAGSLILGHSPAPPSGARHALRWRAAKDAGL